MLRIRLTRRGAKKDPHYRVVVAEQGSPRDGRFKEIVGFYNPAKQPALLNLQLDRVDYWLNNGAQPTETVKTLIRRVRESEKAAVQESEEQVNEPETSDKS
ncbi:MAG: 30S ribosomal protein S16 [Acidobacteriota bacterium]|nr:MAG: 30S ribosomal protein S16 [Acidobacteriota bacterium]